MAVARVSSWPVRARICRERAAGLIFLYWAFIRITGIRARAGSPAARRCGVAARTWVLLTVAPWRTLAMSFLLRQQVIGEDPVQLQDLVEQFQFRGGAIA